MPNTTDMTTRERAAVAGERFVRGYAIAGRLGVPLLCACVAVIPWVDGGVRSPVMATMPMLLLLVGWMRGRRAMAGVGIFFIAEVCFYWFVDSGGWRSFEMPLRAPQGWAAAWLAVIFLGGFVAWFLVGNRAAGFVEQAQSQQLQADANLSIAENERFFRSVTDNVPGMLAYWDADLRCRFANKAFFDWFGKTRQEMAGIALPTMLGPVLYAVSEPYVQGVLSGQPQVFERTVTKYSGGIGHLRVNYTPEFDDQRRVIGFFTYVADVTAQKQSEEAQRIAATAFESHEAMVITDADEVILQVNRAFTQATGYTAQDAVGQTPRILKSGRHDAQFYEAMWRSIAATGTWEGEIWDRRKNGELYPNWLHITAVKGADGVVTHYVGAQFDITSRKAAEAEITQLAYVDALTGLPNRRIMLDRLRLALASSTRSGHTGALMFVDLDNFKSLNDSHGHDKGDLLLQQVAERLSVCVREIDTVTRFGGDEFVVMLERLSADVDEARAQAAGVGAKILAALGEPYDLDGLVHSCTPSIGVALFRDRKYDINQILKQADVAMYRAKAGGRNTMRFYDDA